MPIYTLKLLDKREIAHQTYIFIFSKPDHFTFIPGQYAGFTLPILLKTQPTNSTRRFSLLSTPQDEHLVIATRMQPSSYKQALIELPIGSEVKCAGPSGNFVLHADTHIPAVLIAGGIGITPFYSMIQSNFEQSITRPIYLFYANRTLSEAAFLTTLSSWQKEHAQFNFIPILTDSIPTNWQGESGFLSYDMLKKYIEDLTQPVFYICGSPTMVQSVQTTLLELDILPEKIKIEDFPGYS